MSEYIFAINGREYRAELLELSGEQATVRVDGQEFCVGLKQFGTSRLASLELKRAEAAPVSPGGPAPAAATRAPGAPPRTGPAVPPGEAVTAVKAPLPGLLTAIGVQVGDSVRAGQNVAVMEAMKMENQIQAPCDGTVSKVYVKKGDNVAEGSPLLEIARSAISTL